MHCSLKNVTIVEIHMLIHDVCLFLKKSVMIFKNCLQYKNSECLVCVKKGESKLLKTNYNLVRDKIIEQLYFFFVF